MNSYKVYFRNNGRVDNVFVDAYNAGHAMTIAAFDRKLTNLIDAVRA